MRKCMLHIKIIFTRIFVQERCAQGMISRIRLPEQRRQPSWASLRKHKQQKTCVSLSNPKPAHTTGNAAQGGAKMPGRWSGAGRGRAAWYTGSSERPADNRLAYFRGNSRRPSWMSSSKVRKKQSM